MFSGKDPYWSPQIIKKAADFGFHADESGKMVKPDNFDQLEQEMRDKLNN